MPAEIVAAASSKTGDINMRRNNPNRCSVGSVWIDDIWLLINQ